MEFKKRAISELEKIQKCQHIIDTAERLLEDADFHEITMAKMAAEAGLAKGTLFIYFQTKEDVFLLLMEKKLTQWSSSFANKMEVIVKSNKYIQLEDFIDMIISSIDNKVFIKLLAILDDTLEQNIDYKRAVQHKTFLRGIMVDLGKLIEAILPMLHEGDGMTILNQLFICFIGTYKVSNPSAIVKQVLQEPGLEIFDRDFIKTLRDMATYYIVGYIAFNRRQ